MCTEEITDKTVYEDVLQVLSRYKSRASLETVHSYPTENLVVEINGNDNRKPFHNKFWVKLILNMNMPEVSRGKLWMEKIYWMK